MPCWRPPELLLAIGLLVFGTAPVFGQALVADLSRHLVAISTGFTGTDVVLFGAIDGPGEVAVVVTGPRDAMVVRRKDRVAGIWLNRTNVRFEQVPRFYVVATSAPLEGLASSAVLDRHQIGLSHMALRAEAGTGAALSQEFRSSLIRIMQRAELFREASGDILFLGQKLFRTNIYFPANVPTGIYNIGVFLIRDGEVVSAQSTPLSVSKVGLSAEIFQMASRYPYLYAFAAVAAALLIGWAAGAAFRD